MIPIYDRFARRVVVNDGGCWIWTGALGRTGYGQLGTTDGKIGRTHRISWELHVGPIPDGACVCHKCDVPSCCNPSHLFLGSQTDNVRDMYSKGREPDVSGERNPRAKLTEDIVREIRASGETGVAIAKRLRINRVAVSQVRTGKTWRHVT